jgi:hypothetical protein
MRARRETLESIMDICDDVQPINPDTATEAEKDLVGQLEARVVRPKNFPLRGGHDEDSRD